MQNLVLNTSCGRVVIDTGILIRVEASSNYCKLYFSNGKTLITAKLLKWFEETLPSAYFVRMHRSHLVNLHLLQPDSLVENRCILKNSESIRISRRIRKQVLTHLLAV